MRIMARTKTRVPYADEVEASGEPPEDLEALIREAKGEEERGTEDIIEVSFTMNYDIFKANCIPFFSGTILCLCICLDLQHEVVLTEDEKSIKAYLSDGDPLAPHILDMVIAPYWKKEPYM